MKERFSPLTQKFRTGIAAFSAFCTLSLYAYPTLAADPFRANEPRQIGENTEAAFKAVFEEGNYRAAERYLKKAASSEPNEPLAYAMQASFAYTTKDFDALKASSQKTLDTAMQLMSKDPLRGNLYAAVGHFLRGAVAITRDGSVRGTPQALSELRQVYEYMDKAEAISPKDPELNLLRGYMDLMIGVNLPFSRPEQAIERLERFAGPQYLAYRGIALGYRDLDRYSEALGAVDRALKVTPENPELYYLKAQILAEQGKKQNNQSLVKEAVENFDKAIAKKEQLPNSLVKQMERERRRAARRLNVAER